MQFIEQANKQQPTIKLTAEISDTETTFLDTNSGIYKGERFKSNSVLDVRTHFKPTETFQPQAHLLVPPIRSQKRLRQRRSSETSQNKLF